MEGRADGEGALMPAGRWNFQIHSGQQSNTRTGCPESFCRLCPWGSSSHSPEQLELSGAAGPAGWSRGSPELIPTGALEFCDFFQWLSLTLEMPPHTEPSTTRNWETVLSRATSYSHKKKRRFFLSCLCRALGWSRTSTQQSTNPL